MGLDEWLSTLDPAEIFVISQILGKDAVVDLTKALSEAEDCAFVYRSLHNIRKESTPEELNQLRRCSTVARRFIVKSKERIKQGRALLNLGNIIRQTQKIGHLSKRAK